VLEQLAAAGKGDRLKGFEMIKAVHLDSEHFSVENDLLTPTFKAKRPQLQKKYQGAIDAMYKSLGQ
jgi:long-chain acyl-CoA synthetase